MTDKIRWGVLSTASHGKKALIPAIKESKNGEVVAISSRGLDKAEAAAKELDIPKAYGSYEELIADPDIDAIYNPLPVSFHAEWSIKCAEAGKPTLCEKPLALNADEVRQMIAAFEKHNVTLGESIMYHFHPLTRTVKKMVEDGAVGKIRMVYAQFNAACEDPSDIRLRKETGGGALLDVGCYCTSVMRLLAGEEPDSIKANAVFNENDIDLITTASMQFPSGVVGHMGCALDTFFDCSYGISGTEGRILVDRGAMCAWPGEAFKIKYENADGMQEIETPEANHYKLIAEDFADAVLQKRKPTVSLEETLNNMITLDRIMESCRQG
ncbi:MAG: Gfo/Idh/MocA family protein [Candidatus Sumerlaeia bacterium]